MIGSGSGCCSKYPSVFLFSSRYDFMVVCWLVAMHEGVEQDCRLHAEPSDGAAGDYLGEECDCFHVGWLSVDVLYVVLRDCRRGVVANGQDFYSI